MKSVVAACVLAVVLASSSATPHSLESDVRGDARTTDAGELVLQGILAGETTGTINVTLRSDGTPAAVGHWRVSFTTQTADGSVLETGSLRGVITGGTVASLPENSGTALSDLTLSIQDGSGAHASVTSGSGRANFRVGRPGEPFTGSFSLSF